MIVTWRNAGLPDASSWNDSTTLAGPHVVSGDELVVDVGVGVQFGGLPHLVRGLVIHLPSPVDRQRKIWGSLRSGHRFRAGFSATSAITESYMFRFAETSLIRSRYDDGFMRSADSYSEVALAPSPASLRMRPA